MSLTYFSKLLSEWFGPDWTRTILLGGTFLSEAGVAIGILLESKFKTRRDWAAAILVVGGVCAGVFFTLVLFANDEEISSAQQDTISVQQSKIIALEKKVTPRLITDNDAANLVENVRPFSGTPFTVESAPAAEIGFVNRVIVLLQKAGWKEHSYSESIVSLPPGDIGNATDQISGVDVRINASRLADFRNPAEAFAVALTQALKASVPIIFDPPDSPHACSPDAIHIQIDRKL
jgi:hypothetical protein